jgi:hypothetical protein
MRYDMHVSSSSYDMHVSSSSYINKTKGGVALMRGDLYKS